MDSSRFLSVSRREAEQDGVPVCSSGTVAAGGSLPLHIFIYFLVDGFEHVHFQLGRWSHYLLCHVVSLRDGNHQPVIVEWLSQGWAVVKSTGRMTWRAPPDDPHVRRLQQTLGPKNHLDENISKIGNGRIVVASGMVWSVVLPFWTPPCWDIPSFFNFHRGKKHVFFLLCSHLWDVRHSFVPYEWHPDRLPRDRASPEPSNIDTSPARRATAGDFRWWSKMLLGQSLRGSSHILKPWSQKSTAGGKKITYYMIIEYYIINIV